MGDGPNPVVALRRLRTELRNARAKAELTQEAVAEAMVWSVSKVIRIEAGQNKPSVNDVKALLDLYGIRDKARVAELVELAKPSRQPSWWDDYSDVIGPGAFRQFIEFEAAASIIRGFQPVMVPGLLQTEEYAWNVIRLFVPDAPASEVDKRVRVRMRRQESATRENGPSLHFVLDEATLRRRVGDRDVMRRQLLYLAELATRPNCSIEIVPFGHGLHPAMQGPFVLVEFPNAADADVVFLESPRGDVIFKDDHDRASLYRGMFKQLQERSLGTEESLTLIRAIAA